MNQVSCQDSTSASLSKNVVSALQIHANYFLLTWKLLKKLADDLCSSISKGNIYHIKQLYIQHFTTVVKI